MTDEEKYQKSMLAVDGITSDTDGTGHGINFRKSILSANSNVSNIEIITNDTDGNITDTNMDESRSEMTLKQKRFQTPKRPPISDDHSKSKLTLKNMVSMQESSENKPSPKKFVNMQESTDNKPSSEQFISKQESNGNKPFPEVTLELSDEKHHVQENQSDWENIEKHMMISNNVFTSNKPSSVHREKSPKHENKWENIIRKMKSTTALISDKPSPVPTEGNSHTRSEINNKMPNTVNTQLKLAPSSERFMALLRRSSYSIQESSSDDEDFSEEEDEGGRKNGATKYR